jgi:hypothetical protein
MKLENETKFSFENEFREEILLKKELSTEISPEQCVGVFEEHFKCATCFNVVNNPK